MPKSQPKSQITARDLIPFIGLECLVDGEKHCLDGVDIRSNTVFVKNTVLRPECVKPILKTLDCLTIEDTVYISCDIMGYDRGTKPQQKKWNNNDLRDIEEYGFIQFDTKDSIHMPHIMHYLTKKGFNLHLIPYGSYVIQDKKGKIEDIIETVGGSDWSKEKTEEIKQFCKNRKKA